MLINYRISPVLPMCHGSSGLSYGVRVTDEARAVARWLVVCGVGAWRMVRGRGGLRYAWCGGEVGTMSSWCDGDRGVATLYRYQKLGGSLTNVSNFCNQM